MRPTTNPTRTALATIAILATAGCSAKDSSATNGRAIELAPSSSAQRPVSDAPVPTNSAQPSVSTGTPTTAQAMPVAASSPARPPAGGRMGVIGAGTHFTAHAVPNVCTNTHHVGDIFTAQLTEPVEGSNGVSIPEGSRIRMRVVESSRSEDSKNRAKLSFTPVSVSVNGTAYAFNGRVTQIPKFNMERAQSTQRQAEKVGAGAAIGAVIGQVAGKNTRSTVVGAVVGGLGGAAVASATADYDACIPNTGSIQIILDRALAIRQS